MSLAGFKPDDTRRWRTIGVENPVEGAFLASDTQARLWADEQLNPGLVWNNTGFQRKITGPLNIQALGDAFLALVQRHEILRTTYEMRGDVLMQHVESSERATVRLLDGEGTEASALDILATEKSTPFSLSREIPVRFAIIQMNADVHFVSMIVHRIAVDVWSQSIIDQELSTLYNAFCEDKQPKLSLLPLRYRDYPVWQRDRAAGSLDSQLNYWRSQLEGAVPLELSTDFGRPEKLSGKAEEVPFDAEASCVSSLFQLATLHQTSLYVALLAAFRATIYRITGEDDGNIGMVNPNRPMAELENVVGYFSNIHAIRLQVDSTTSLEDLIVQAKRVVTEAQRCSDLHFDDLVAKLSSQRPLSRNALVQLMFVLHDFSGTARDEGFQGTIIDEIRDSFNTHFDLSMHLFIQGEGLQGYVIYQSDLFRLKTIKTFIRVFQRVLATGTQQPSLSVSKLQLSTLEDLQKLAMWNNTTKPCRLDTSVGDRFREAAAREGSALAVYDKTVSLSYTELDERSDRLAAWLVGKGLGREEVVGVWMGRSVLLVVAYLGCLKAGLAYMPLDKSHPLERLRLMCQMANCRLTLVAGECPLAGKIECINIARHKEITITTPRIDLPVVTGCNLSNIMFTSGSTGTPKGVMLEHRGLLNLCAPETTAWPEKRRNGLTTSIGFDPSGFQIFTTLLGGSELYCFPDTGTFDAHEYVRFMIEHRVQRISITPSILAALLDTTDDWLERCSLEHLLLGGEPLEPSKIAECRRRIPNLRVSSSYGPTEASVRSAYFDVPLCYDQQNIQRIPLGHALPNTCLYIVDEALNPVPAGVLGEIVMSGVHLGRGYLNQPQRTAECFVELPSHHPLGSLRLYRSGDLGFWTEDGLVRFVGRADTQMKLRGHRIEAGEIEDTIQHHPAVKSNAAVLVKTQNGDQLIAYVVLHSHGPAAVEKHVLALWGHHYNEESSYGSLHTEIAGHDFARWFSMFTSERIPIDQMHQWLDDTINQIAPRSEDRVLEVGVGTGMIALNIADCVQSYTGTDLSVPALKFLEAQIKLRELSPKVSLIKMAAHEIDSLPKTAFSLIIFNSVIQYFPSAEYLTRVIEKLLAVMDNGGRIYMGDLRSYSLILYHNVERALAALEADATVDDVQVMLERYMEGQTELLVNPSFFLTLQRHFPAIVHVEIKPKLMHVQNELSNYRYTAILHVNAQPELTTPSSWLDCSFQGWTISDLRSELRATEASVIGALNIPVANTEGVRQILDRIKSKESGENVHTLRQMLTKHTSSNLFTAAGIDQMAREEGWRVTLDYTLQGGPENSFRAIFKRNQNGSVSGSHIVGNFPSLALHGPSHNILATGPISLNATLSSVEAHLRERLPAYMVPSRIISVAELPLHRTGKLDRKLLASPEYLSACEPAILSKEIEGPSTDIERDVLAIFSRMLNHSPDTIDIKDNLFKLGGHSLLATLVVNAIQRDLRVELSMSSFFRRPTVKDVAIIVANQRESKSPNDKVLLDSNNDGAALASATIMANADHSGPTLFIFFEMSGFASVYASAFENISCKVVAFGDKHWGRPLDGESIQSIAADLINKLRRIQPEGPYYLSGWSFGGYVSFEAARQLENAGIPVAVLIMFDPKIYDEPSQAIQWSSDLDHLLTVVDDKASWLAQFDRANTLISNYKISRGYTGKTVLVKALRIERDRPLQDSHNGWLQYIPQLEVRGFDASHRRMFDRENGPIMGTLISQIIKETTGSK